MSEVAATVLMPKILVVGSRHDQMGEISSLKDYRQYFQVATRDKAEVSYAMLDDLIFDISPKSFSIFDSHNNTELSRYDLIILRGKLLGEIDLVIAISNYAKLHEIPYFNDWGNFRSMSKLAQAVDFYKLKLPFPRTIYCSQGELKKRVADDVLSLPFIYKNRYGAHGENNFLIQSLDQLSEINTRGMIAQEFVPNDCDYRILIIGDQHLVIRRRSTKGGHLHNTSQGGSAELVTNFDQRIIKSCHELADRVNMQTVGVDVIIDKENGRHYFLEINSQPQLKTGAFIKEKQKLAGKLIGLLLK